ncbi:hypothetical protein [Actinokineospora sp. UTMC 2448]|uniref:hypothetical protein n=1 Tax=Actinokineospora sp. UTMC 2448 TaxID=2268449 RepID=UPI0021645FE5|nr:hypothetical protein [Actinokineospora sp. UTMC 2448]UVS79469.1 DNA internalization-related competence protein ComEC/Rec2 [Actinokineospora sp. UTMC 2448]
MSRSACLEIHAINVSQGDLILIINRDLAKVKEKIEARDDAELPGDPIDWVPYARHHGVSLYGTVRKALWIDGGDTCFADGVYVLLEDWGVVDRGETWFPHLSILVSHFHDDHIGALTNLFGYYETKVIDKKKRKVYCERIRPAAVYLNVTNSAADAQASTLTTDLRRRIKEGRVASAEKATAMREVWPGGLTPETPDKASTPVEIDLGTGVDDIPIKCVLRAAHGVFNPVTKTVHKPKSRKGKWDENDRSLAVVVEYGSFRYFAAGDIAGDGRAGGGNEGDNAMPDGPGLSSGHGDMEKPLREALTAAYPKTEDTGWTAGRAKFTSAGYATVMKISHHGSASSTDVHTLATLRPLVVTISAGYKIKYHAFPRKQVVNRMDPNKTSTWKAPDGSAVPNSVKGVYLTEPATKNDEDLTPKALPDHWRVVGDIVVRPVDESVRAVQKSIAKGEKIEVQVYGVGIQEKPESEKFTLRPLAKKNTEGVYPIGPFWHSDEH